MILVSIELAQKIASGSCFYQRSEKKTAEILSTIENEGDKILIEIFFKNEFKY